jgi:hypothetical protein
VEIVRDDLDDNEIAKAPAEEPAGASARVNPAESGPPQTSDRTADDIARLLAERSLPNGRGGVLVWLWILAVPLLWLATVLTLLNNWEGFWILLPVSLTGRALSKASAAASEARSALLLPELDRGWLGPLIDALAYPNGTVRTMSRLRLVTVLPTVDENTASDLAPGRRALLFDHLSSWRAWSQPDLVCAILRFGAAIGDERALGGTEQLADMRAFNSGQRAVRCVARQCLPILEERIAERAAAAMADSEQTSELAARRDLDAPSLSPSTRMWLAEIEAESKTQPGMRYGFLIASWGVMVPYGVFQTVYQWGQGKYLFSILFLLAAAGATQLYRLTLTPQQQRLAGKLASTDDVGAVGALAEMTTWPDERIKSMAKATLTRLLPRMKASDTQLLSASQRRVLYQFLNLEDSRHSGDLQIALLAALEQVGDIAALPLVRELADHVPNSLSQRRVVDSARSCLPFLEGCAQQNYQSQTLLRPITGAEMDLSLLRPAGKSVETNPELLVRVAAPPETAL